MTIQSLDTIIDRIGAATEENPLAVFRHEGKEKNNLIVYPYNTYWTRKLCISEKDLLVGVYSKVDRRLDVLRALQQAVFQQTIGV